MDVAMMNKTHPSSTLLNLDKLAQMFIDAFPTMNASDQRLALSLYRMLAEGAPAPRSSLANALGRGADEVNATLGSWPGVFYDDTDRIIGFWGISVKEMTHRLVVNGKTAYAWCAWDALFLPELLDATAHVTSRCVACGDVIDLVVSPGGIESSNPRDVMVSFLIPAPSELEKNATASFCHFVHFFRDREAGESWVAEHEDTFLLSLADAFALGQTVNQARFQDVLERKGTHYDDSNY